MTTQEATTRTLRDDDGDTGFAPVVTPRATSSTGASFFSSMASLLGLQLEDTVFCQICYDDVPLSKSHALSACGHRFCTSCLQSYLAFQIQEGETELQCFFQETVASDSTTDSACLTPIPTAEIQQLVDTTTYAKFTRFRFNKQHTTARQCPYCDHSQVCDTTGQFHSSHTAEAPQCVCKACARVFCFVHGNAHPSESCRSYTKRTRKDEQQNLVAISRTCKPCPGCGQLVEKDGGCNQIKCWACKTSFCWICRAVVDEAAFPTHYQWWNVGGCSSSYDAASAVDDQTTKCDRITLAVGKAIFLTIFGPPALLLATVCSVVCCCCYPCTKVYNVSYRQAFTSCVCVSGYIVLLPLLVPAAMLFLPCLLLAFCVSPQSLQIIWGDSAPRQDAQRATRLVEGHKGITTDDSLA